MVETLALVSSQQSFRNLNPARSMVILRLLLSIIPANIACKESDLQESILAEPYVPSMPSQFPQYSSTDGLTSKGICKSWLSSSSSISQRVFRVARVYLDAYRLFLPVHGLCCVALDQSLSSFDAFAKRNSRNEFPHMPSK